MMGGAKVPTKIEPAQRIKLFYDDIVLAIKRCDYYASVACAKKDNYGMESNVDARTQLESLLWKYSKLFEGELR